MMKRKLSNQQIEKITDLETINGLVEDIKATGRNITHREMLSLPEGTLVRIKPFNQFDNEVLTGKLVFQRAADVDNDEHRYGVRTSSYVNYTYPPRQYELIAFPA